MSGHLVHFGVTHQSAPVSVRERFQPDVDGQRALLRRLAGLAAERAVLATCARFEIYAVLRDPSPAERQRLLFGLRSEVPLAACPPVPAARGNTGRRAARGTQRTNGAGVAAPSAAEFAAATQLPCDVHAGCFRTRVGEACARHLLRVASGLESQVLGEPQVLGQVRRSFETGTGVGSIGPVLSALFRTAIHAGRMVRQRTGINAQRRSIAEAAAEYLARQVPGPDRVVVIVGAGTLARDVALALRGSVWGAAIVVSRSGHHGRSVAGLVGGRHEGMDRLVWALNRADAVIVCTSSPSYVVDRQSLANPRGGHLHVVDLSVPRNVDPGVSSVAGVHVTHLDELVGGRLGMNPADRDDVLAAERIVEEQLARFRRWERARSVAPLIEAWLRPAGAMDETSARRWKRAVHQPIQRLVEEVMV